MSTCRHPRGPHRLGENCDACHFVAKARSSIPGMALARIEAAVRTIDALNAQVASTTEEQNQVGREC